MPPPDHRAAPHDDHAERDFIGALVLQPYLIPRARLMVLPADLYSIQTRRCYEAILVLDDEGRAIDATSVAAVIEADGTNGGPQGGWRRWVMMTSGDVPASGHVYEYAQIIAERAARRRMIGALGGMVHDAYDLSVPYFDLLRRADEALRQANLPRAAEPADTLDEFIAPEDDYDWVLPTLLERGDRCIVVADEGGGKSTLLRQVAVQVSQGIHPFDAIAIEPKRVLLVDLENPARLLRRRLRELRELAEADSRDFDASRLRIVSKPEGLDLSQHVDALDLLHAVAANRPDLIIIGPLYKMHQGEEEKSSDVRVVQRVLDTLRIDFGCTLIMETHAPHQSFQGGKLRIAGSRVWQRWPEFVLGLARTAAEGGQTYNLKEVRTGRDLRPWPSQLVRGGRWPWQVNPVYF